MQYTHLAQQDKTEHLIDISKIATLREKANIKPELMAMVTAQTVEEYLMYESGEKEIPASDLFVISAILTGDALNLFNQKA